MPLKCKNMSKGVLLIALGHSNYGRMALNLAASLKTTDPNVQIALAFAGQSLNDIGHYPIGDYFDHFIPVGPECYTRKEKTEWIKAKTFMYDLSPFDETIFLDVDMLWHPQMPISNLFTQLGANKKLNLTFQNRGFLDLSKKDLPKDYSMWADVNEVKRAYGIKKGKYYQLHSEFVYFRKCDEVKKYFDDAKDIYDNLMVESFVFGGGIPDELPFGISMMLNNMYPHETPFTPVYWEVTEKRAMQRTPAKLYSEFYAYSCGGSFHSKTMKQFYNNLAKFYFNKAGLQYPYYLTNKRDYLPERTNL